MSVQSEITRIQTAKRDSLEEVGAKGVEVPPEAKLDDLPSLIRSVPGPKPEQTKTVTITANGDVPIKPDAGSVLAEVLAKVAVPGSDVSPYTKIEVRTWIGDGSNVYPVRFDEGSNVAMFNRTKQGGVSSLDNPGYGAYGGLNFYGMNESQYDEVVYLNYRGMSGIRSIGVDGAGQEMKGAPFNAGEEYIVILAYE